LLVDFLQDQQVESSIRQGESGKDWKEEVGCSRNDTKFKRLDGKRNTDGKKWAGSSCWGFCSAAKFGGGVVGRLGDKCIVSYYHHHCLAMVTTFIQVI
jgi:hypothetical protein